VTDTLRFIDGEPVTALTDAEEIERIYLMLTGVLVEVEEAIRAATPRQNVSLVLGEVVTTPGALEELSPWQLRHYLDRHQSGDWGCVCPEDAETNFEAVRDGYRVLSAYPINAELPCKGYGENCVWIITEADRSVTTFLLPDEY
jgi:hypothetical protein